MALPAEVSIQTPASEMATAVDGATLYVVAVSAVLLAVVTGTMLYFLYRYSRKRHPLPEHVPPNHRLEVAWTVIPTLLVLSMFWYGFEGFKLLRTIPDDAMPVQVIARMWEWSFEYENGKKSPTLYVPVNTAIKLKLKSLDVIHSFYVPAFRIKEDAVPGRDNLTWFKADSLGTAQIFCAEYCGDRHSYMLSEVVVLPEDEFAKWLASAEESAEVAEADALLVMRAHGCVGCHSRSAWAPASGAVGTAQAPSLEGIYGTRIAVITNGVEREIEVDDDYLRRSIRDPWADIVKGYGRFMPQQPALPDHDMEKIVAYLRGAR